MRKLLVTTFLTLDGVMQAPGGPEEDPSGKFAFGGWSTSYWDETLDQAITQIMAKPFDLVLGRRTYDIFAGFWPTAPEEAGAAPLNAATKYVASRGRPDLPWDKSVLLEGDAAAAVASLKQTDGPELQVHGSGNLIQSLLPAGLIDEFHLWFHPVVLGQGRKLFADGAVPAGLKLVDTKVSSSGVIIGTYVPAGAVKLGSFAG
jgi:dihydrofolate reductase